MGAIHNKLVSVIIPVYNVEKYLDKCIKSVAEQSYSNLEIILIDDGSTDDSALIIDKWAERDERIKVMHLEHRGVSNARNAGLEIMSGDFICFVDSDDYVGRTFVEDLVEVIIRTGTDIAFCDIESERLSESEAIHKKADVISIEECRRFLYNPLSREYVEMVVIWNKIYNSKLFENLRFEEDKIHEDDFLMNNFMYKLSGMGYVDSKNYYYRYNSEGITGEKNCYNIEHLNIIDAYEDRISFALDNSDGEFATVTFKWALLKLVDYYRHGDIAMKNTVKGKYKKLFKKHSKMLTAKQRVKYGLFVISPNTYCSIF